MAIYILSNRAVVEDDGIERFENKPKNDEAGVNFRIAKMLDTAKREYEIFPDTSETSYSNTLDMQIDKLTGSHKLFSELYLAGESDEQHGDILFFIHGFNYSFEDNLEHIRKLEKHYMGKNKAIKHMVYLSWPSKGSYLYYPTDYENARITGRELGRIFKKLRSFFHDSFCKTHHKPCSQKLHLAAHSLANEVVYHMLDNIHDSDLKPTFTEALLLNSDAPYYGFEPGRPFSKLDEIAERIHIYINRSDDALMVSDKVMGQSKRLGKYGPKNRHHLPEEGWVVDCSDVEGKTSLKQATFDHWGYLHRDEVIDDINAVLDGQEEFAISGRIESHRHHTFKL